MAPPALSRAAAVSALAGGLRRGPLVAGVLVFAPALALYVLTLMPGVGTWDTAEFQAIGPVLGIAHPTGFPTYTLTAWVASVVLQPFGEPALRANLLSALLAAGAAGLTAAVVTALTTRFVAGVAAGAALAVAPTAWSVGLRADAHALHLFLLAVLLALLVGWADRITAGRPADRWLLAATVVYGFSLGNHALTLLLAPGIALFVLAVRPRILWLEPRLVAGCALVLAATTVAVYAYLPIRSAMDPPLDYANPETWDGFRYLVFAEQFRGTFRNYPPLTEAVRFAADETLRQLGLLALLALPGAVVALFRRPALLLLLSLWIAVTWAFALGYVNADIERYYLGPTLAAAVLGGIAVAGVIEIGAALLARLARRLPYASRASRRATGVALAAVIFVGPTLALVPGRFNEVDLSSETTGREWLDAVLPQLEQDAVVISWWSWSTPLWYAQHVEGRRPDLEIFDDRDVLDEGYGTGQAIIERFLDQRPVYLIRMARDLPEFEAEYRLSRLPGIPYEPVYRVEGRLADV